LLAGPGPRAWTNGEGNYVTFETNNSAGKALRRALVCSASVAVIGLSATPAMAQDDGAADNRPIVVTGTRLVTTGMDTPVPVTAVEGETLEAMDPSSLINSVSQLPQFIGNTTPNFSNFFQRGGTGNLNLRGLGPNRTLTLLNGRRVAPNSAFGGVDINLFPEAMIKGIETTTGGASAAYGSDAVSGVVNFLLDTDFEGLEVELQGGITSRGDAENYEGSISYGMDIGDRGHFLISGTRAKQNGVHNYDGRSWYQSYGSILVNGVWGDYPNVVSANGSFDGIIESTNPLIDNLQFKPDGTYAPFVLGSPASGTSGVIGTSGARSSGGSGDDLGCGEVCTIWPDTDRYSDFAYADYELADGFTIFAQYLRGYNHQWQYSTPRGYMLGNPQGAITIYQDNAFLPTALHDVMVANNIQSFNLRRYGSIEDVGNTYYEDTITQNTGTIGFDYNVNNGGFLDGWLLSGYYQYGKSHRVWDQMAMRVDRIFAAVDAVKDGSGNIVCRASLDPQGKAAFPGCQPINLFGRGNASDAAVDWVMGNDVGLNMDVPLYFANLGFTGERLKYTSVAPKRNIANYVQQFAELSAAGNLFDVPAGPVSVAFGASYRRESIYQVVQDTANVSSIFDVGPAGHPIFGEYHPCSAALAAEQGYNLGTAVPQDCGNTVAFQFSKVSNIQGAISVKEAFAETLIPIFDNGSGSSAALNVAARYADYTGSGSIWSYKGGLDVNVVEGFRLRGTYSRDVRAGNLSERFDKTGGAASVTDPRITAADVTACQTANPGNPNCTNSFSVTTFSGGNPSINPERGDTFTAGAVLQPEFLPGFSASVDWYLIKLKDAIAQLTSNDVVRRCVIDQEAQFCDLVSFDGTTFIGNYPKVSIVGNQYVNVNLAKVEGVDAEIAYRTNMNFLGGGDESIAFRTFIAYLIERSDTGAPNAQGVRTTTRTDGLVGIAPDTGAAGIFPKVRVTGNVTYRNGPFTMFLAGRLIGSGHRSYTLAANAIADNDVPAVFYADMRLTYEFSLGDSTIEVFGSVTNMFDKSPPVSASFAAFGGNSTQANFGLYDVLGRRFTAGVKFKL
jgi:outer membrane receptor protein involved in Fe transport